ncbi:MAG TPA: hypothetical protein VFN09_10240 [Rhodanobacteraceae bacterium]|nr:hypothetical protein [Rhodanobacteraceae bacterium]
MRELAAQPRQMLADGWRMAVCMPDAAPDAHTEWLPATLPATVAGVLRAGGRWSLEETRDFDRDDVWWQLDFEAAPGAAVLGFDGLATLAEVWLDGALILASDNMFRAHRVPVELTGTSHRLTIRCRALAPELKRKRPRPRWRVPMLVEQQLRWFRTTLLGRTPGWSPPCAAVGPWQPVWIERESPRLTAVRMDARLHDGCGQLHFQARMDPRLDDARLLIEHGAARHAVPITRDGTQAQALLALDSPRLWWPHSHGEPARYRVAVEAVLGAEAVRIELGHIGFRHIELDQQAGEFALRVNGVPVFCRGACWTPLDVVTLAAPMDQVQAAVAQLTRAGMNMLRIPGVMTYASDALLEALDAAGVLLWQDLMFANMDYPEEDAFTAAALDEVEQQLARLAPHPCLALVCGNSEVEQQAAMSGAGSERWTPPLFHQAIPPLVAAIGANYVPSSAHGGAFPHAVDAGPSSYYGVGAYRRALVDARDAGLRFASECLGFANLPRTEGLPGGAAARVHQALWKQRAPRDLGAGWDFDDVRDHYLRTLFGVDPVDLRASDHARYLQLGRATSAEVMARCFSEWRRLGSATRGALVWFLRDLWPGAGWGIVAADGTPKSTWYALRRVLAPRALLCTDEGVNGLRLHAVNDRPQPLDAQLVVTLWRDGAIHCGSGECALRVPAHAATAIAPSTLFDGFIDLNHAYRFGPPVAELVHAQLRQGDVTVAEAYHWPLGPPPRQPDLGLTAELAGQRDDHALLRVRAEQAAYGVNIELPGWLPDDDGFHLAPGQWREIRLQARAERRAGSARGSVTALNSQRAARFEVP